MAKDDEAIVEMCLALYGDGSMVPVSAGQIRRTLEIFREEPVRGRALVLDTGAARAGYALLASFWSNELAGEVCTIDELFVVPEWRGRGCASALIRSLRSGPPLWPRPPVALELEVSHRNVKALALYARLGFGIRWNTTMRMMLPGAAPSEGAAPAALT